MKTIILLLLISVSMLANPYFDIFTGKQWAYSVVEVKYDDTSIIQKLTYRFIKVDSTYFVNDSQFFSIYYVDSIMCAIDKWSKDSSYMINKQHYENYLFHNDSIYALSSDSILIECFRIYKHDSSFIYDTINDTIYCRIDDGNYYTYLDSIGLIESQIHIPIISNNRYVGEYSSVQVLFSRAFESFPNKIAIHQAKELKRQTANQNAYVNLLGRIIIRMPSKVIVKK
jgi:hypothetical protein